MGRQEPGSDQWVKGKLVGCGSFGSVHLAMNKSTGGLFVVKSPHSRAGRQALDKEVKILNSLKSPYIVQCLGTEDQGKLNVFMEYMAGGSLADVAHKFGGSLDEEVVRVYTREILHGLKHLHQHGIVHCDLKCKNVLLGSSGNIKLADFGCAVVNCNNNTTTTTNNNNNNIGGTPLWMAPEVLRNESPNFAADIWSLGCTVIEMATGTPPWAHQLSNPITAVLTIAHADAIPHFPPNFSNEGFDFLTRCFERQPDKRPTVQDLLTHPFVSTTPTPPPVSHQQYASCSPGNDFSITNTCHDLDHPKDLAFGTSGNWITVRSG